MDKAEGAFLTIGELAQELGVPQHILRYWETRFPQLRPLQRSGNRRYYRPRDVEIARAIHRLLSVEGFTIKGAVKILDERLAGRADADSPPETVTPVQEAPVPPDQLIERLRAIRTGIAEAVGLE